MNSFHTKLCLLINSEITNSRGLTPLDQLLDPLIDVSAFLIVKGASSADASTEAVVDIFTNKLDKKVIEHERKIGTYRPSQRGGDSTPALS